MIEKNISEVIKETDIFINKYNHEIKMSLKKYCENKKYNNLNNYVENLYNLLKKLKKKEYKKKIKYKRKK